MRSSDFWADFGGHGILSAGANTLARFRSFVFFAPNVSRDQWIPLLPHIRNQFHPCTAEVIRIVAEAIRVRHPADLRDQCTVLAG